MSRPALPPRTTPPGRYLLFYDGLCRFCEAGSRRLLRLARPDAIDRINFQAPGALEPYPGLTHDYCMKEMKLVTPDGRVYGGFEAAVRALATRPLVGWLAYLYYVPGLHGLLDWAYRMVAARRYRLMGKVGVEECAGGTCALHLQQH